MGRGVSKESEGLVSSRFRKKGPFMKSPLCLLFLTALILTGAQARAEDDILDEGDAAAFRSCVRQCISGSSECNEPDMDSKGRPIPNKPGDVRRCCERNCADKK